MTETAPDVAKAMSEHNLSPGITHTDLQVSGCACRYGGSVVMTRPQQTGEVCASCGGMAVRTGTCTTCVECGTSGGCG